LPTSCCSRTRSSVSSSGCATMPQISSFIQGWFIYKILSIMVCNGPSLYLVSYLFFVMFDLLKTLKGLFISHLKIISFSCVEWSSFFTWSRSFSGMSDFPIQFEQDTNASLDFRCCFSFSNACPFRLYSYEKIAYIGYIHILFLNKRLSDSSSFCIA
jgi:hypothetical protein